MIRHNYEIWIILLRNYLLHIVVRLWGQTNNTHDRFIQHFVVMRTDLEQIFLLRTERHICPLVFWSKN